MKIVFDASIHLGQFTLGSEDLRVACKNSQVRISAKGGTDVIGVVTFEENSWVDHIIWQLGREQQDAFYPFMDMFHTVKNIERIPLSPMMLQGTRELSVRHWWCANSPGFEVSSALTRTAAYARRADLIYTLSSDLLRKTEMGYRIPAERPPQGVELVYSEPGLEEHYQVALRRLRVDGIDLLEMLKEQKNR